MRGALLTTLALLTPGVSAMAQDPVVVDAEHCQVVFENEQVRVVRITYGPGEKSVMHEHPANVAVFLTDGRGKMTMPDGKSQETEWKAGDAVWDPGGRHLPENSGSEPNELIVVELKK